jgi:hypothetical protein
MSPEPYFEHYKQNGFNFSKKLLTRYCLSLYTKPFVILSGISGTGKTKIAQLFQTFENASNQNGSNLTSSPNNGVGYIILKVTDGIVNGDGRGNLKFSDLEAVFEQSDIPAIQSKIDDYRRRGVDDNITEHEKFIIETNEGEFPISLYLQRASSPLLRVRFISRSKETPTWNSQDFVRRHFKVGDVLKFQKVSPRKLKLVAINDTQVVQANEELEDKEVKAVNNKLFVPVRSNWNDNSELLGYYNILEEKYYITPLLKFMLTAKEYPQKPFFLILDEMNLSRVEHYFSDFLSCLESRVLVNGELIQEKIQLHNISSYVDSNDDYFDIVPNSIEIPSNFFVTGTVNIDETTYAFSPKVLDRANVIEFNEVDLNSYEGADDGQSFVLKEFPQFKSSEIAVAKNYIDSPELFKKCVNDLLRILKTYNLHFGYRVINEMALFINNAMKFVGSEDEVIHQAIDVQISQKVLPKLNGAFGKLDEPLRKLISYMTIGSEDNFNSIDLEFINRIDYSMSLYPESLEKIGKLYKNLVFNGFASYLE